MAELGEKRRAQVTRGKASPLPRHGGRDARFEGVLFLWQDCLQGQPLGEIFPRRAARGDKETAHRLAQDQIKTVFRARAIASRRTKTRYRRVRAMYGDQKEVGAAGRVVRIGNKTFEEVLILQTQGSQITGSYAQDGGCDSVRRGALEVQCAILCAPGRL